jgi:hypothetical protein
VANVGLWVAQGCASLCAEVARLLHSAGYRNRLSTTKHPSSSWRERHFRLRRRSSLGK